MSVYIRLSLKTKTPINIEYEYKVNLKTQLLLRNLKLSGASCTHHRAWHKVDV